MHNQRVFTSNQFVFNGIHGHTGAYLLPPQPPASVAAIARGHAPDVAVRDDLEVKARQAHLHHIGTAEGIDPDDLAQTGWGVVFPFVTDGSEAAKRQADVREALAPLLALRRSQATQRSEHYYRELVGRSDAYRPGETKAQFLTRLGVGPGPADPKHLPYYLLLVGSPEEIPYHVQYQLDVQYAVGRLHFDTLDEYANYARSVVEAESAPPCSAPEAVFFGVVNPNDRATALSKEYLIEPIVRYAQDAGCETADWQITSLIGEPATKARLSALLGNKPPKLLFTASHGIGFHPDDPRQREAQGAILCQDWGGPGTRSCPEQYFAGSDIAADVDLRGLIGFHFACYSAGTPKHDEFNRAGSGEPRRLAPGPFVARLPQRMLGHAGGGALASVGHIDRAWGCSFVQSCPEDHHLIQTRITAFESALKSLMDGRRLGYAMEYFDVRYAESSSDLAERIQAIEIYGEPCTDDELARFWLEANDARNYAVIGDPAVRLNVAHASDSSAICPSSPAIAVASTVASSLQRPTHESSIALGEPAMKRPQTVKTVNPTQLGTPGALGVPETLGTEDERLRHWLGHGLRLAIARSRHYYRKLGQVFQSLRSHRWT